ncbi:hypothetical protein Taro_034421 [Colocasia esculenta]|uniref:CCHC-type domain-containing protein n=1 Tax=Colocasia esculenta TaxID=4460 RepID=A0A843VRA6_COLES|nr:hypothetical protein [Colocasia esculenta]
MAGKCLKCGSSKHKIKDCPKLQQGVQRPAPAAAAPATGRPRRPRAQARVFALAREDAEQAEHVTEGTILFMGVTSRVFQILMDHVCNGCGGHREANVVWMCGVRRVDGQVWSLTSLASIEGDVNIKNLAAGFVDVYGDGSLNDIRVDANLCNLQDKASWRIVEREVVSNRARKCRSEV